MRALKLILPLIVLGFIGYQLYDYYDTSQQNEITELNNQVVDELVILQDFVTGIEGEIQKILDPEVELKPANYMLLEMVKGIWVNKFAGTRRNLDAIALPDTPEADALRAEGHAMIDAFEATMPEYDALIEMIVAQDRDFEELREYVTYTILTLQLEQAPAIEAFNAAQEAYLVE